MRGGVLLCAGGPDTSPTQQRRGGVAMTPATAGVIDAACSVRRRSISVQAAAGGSRRAALARPVRPFVSRASSRVAHIAPPGHPREASPTLPWLARCVVAPRHAPGGATGRSSGATRSRTAAAPWLAYRHTRRLLMAGSSGPTSVPRRVSAVRDRAPPRSHRPVRRTVTSLRRDSAPRVRVPLRAHGSYPQAAHHRMPEHLTDQSPLGSSRCQAHATVASSAAPHGPG
jgi:hypothetical protein